MSLGFIKVHRSFIDDALIQKLSFEQRWVLIVLLLVANWRDGEHGCDRCKQTIHVPAGATALSVSALAKLAGVSRGVVLRLLKTCVAHGFLLNESRTGCHALYIIKNWAKYQLDDGAPDQSRYRSRSDVGTEADPIPVPDIRIEEDKKIRSNTPRPAKSQLSLTGTKAEPSPSDWAAAHSLRKVILGRHPEDPCGKDGYWRANGKRWARAIMNAVQQQQLATHAELVAAATWALAHRGYTIADATDLIRKYGRICQDRANASGKNGAANPDEVDFSELEVVL